MFNAACAITLGNYNDAKFWVDNWLPDGRSIATTAPALYSYVRDKGRSVREALQNSSWVRDIRGGVSSQALAQFLEVWDAAQSTVLSPGIRDSPRWRLTENGDFSVSTAYMMFFMASTRFACAKPIWKSKAPPRCKFFMWLAVHRRCLTADNVQHRGWPNNLASLYASRNRKIARTYSCTADLLGMYGGFSSSGLALTLSCPTRASP